MDYIELKDLKLVELDEVKISEINGGVVFTIAVVKAIGAGFGIGFSGGVAIGIAKWF